MKLSENQRIFINILATYGRSVLALLCGLFTSRWILNVLGQSDYGLYGVVGSLTMMASFFSWILVGAISRFYGVCIGKQKESLVEGVLECRRWFNVALSVHVVIPFALFVILYPLGEYAIRNWLVIPFDRVESCVWVFRFSCLTCFLGFVNVPFRAMYIAKQFIAELTVYEVVCTLMNFFFIFYMSFQNGEWLIKFSAWACFISVLPNIIIIIRAWLIFDECHYDRTNLFNMNRFKELSKYVGWQSFYAMGAIVKTQGLAILVNKYFGPIGNAAQGVANSVAIKTDNFAAAMQSAFAPAINAAYGAGDMTRVCQLSYSMCKYGTIMLLLIMLPLSLELPEILRLWLKNPPESASGLSLCIMISILLDRLTSGHKLAVGAKGKIAKYELLSGISIMTSLPICLLLVKAFNSIYYAGIAVVVSMIMMSGVRVCLARDLVGLRLDIWLRQVIVPVLLASFMSVLIGIVPVSSLPASGMRVVVTLFTSEIVLLSSCWFFVLTHKERCDFVLKIRSKLPSTIYKRH